MSVSGHSPVLTPTHEVQMRSEVLEGKTSETSHLIKTLKLKTVLNNCYFPVIPLLIEEY